jgi:PAS domain S-box-containing protein
LSVPLQAYDRIVTLTAAAILALAIGLLLVFRSHRRPALDRRRFRILSAAASISDVAGTVEDTVQRLSGLLVPELADICVIDVVRGDRIERLAVAATGPRATEIEVGLRRHAAETALDPSADEGTAMRSGQAVLIADAIDEHVVAAARDAEDLAFLRSLEARSTIVVPLRARGRSLGSMALIVTATSRRRYDDGDLEFAQVLSGRVALALDNAGLFSELESLEAQQTAALGSLAEAVTIQNARGELVYANDAAARALGFASAPELLATPTTRIVDAFESSLEDGSPLRLEDLPGRRVLAGEEPRPLLIRAVNRATGEERWRLTKATAVLDREGRPQLAVNIIEDVTEVKHAEIAQRFLAEAGALLASSLDYEETLAQVARLAVPQLADWCGVMLPDERGFLRSVAVAHVDPAKVQFAEEFSRRYPSRLEDETGAAQVMRDGLPQVVNEIPDALLEEAVRDREQREALRTLQMRAAMLVPMVAPGRSWGRGPTASGGPRR